MVKLLQKGWNLNVNISIPFQKIKNFNGIEIRIFLFFKLKNKKKKFICLTDEKFHINRTRIFLGKYFNINKELIP